MAKRKRLDFRGSPAKPLIILAGLPHPTCVRIANSIEQKVVPATRVVFQASGHDPKKLYPPHTVVALTKAVTEFAIRQSSIPAPRHILLAYVPSADEEELLTAFDFFVFPLRLNRLSEFDNFGRQYRHDLPTSEPYTIESIRTITPQFMELKRRLSCPSDKEPLFLPPRNFKVSTAESVADKFRAMRRLESAWSDPMHDIARVEVTKSELPKHVHTAAKKMVLADARGLLFPHDPSVHGVPRQLDESRDDFGRTNLMRASFRFGVPLCPGYHHDVQFCGRKLNGQQFDCERQGLIDLHCSYVNVYPNDYIRPSKG